jgi:hypothetical protein
MQVRGKMEFDNTIKIIIWEKIESITITLLSIKIDLFNSL